MIYLLFALILSLRLEIASSRALRFGSNCGYPIEVTGSDLTIASELLFGSGKSSTKGGCLGLFGAKSPSISALWCDFSLFSSAVDLLRHSGNKSIEFSRASSIAERFSV